MPQLEHPAVQWRRVSPKYVAVSFVLDAIWAVVFIAAALVLLLVFDLPWVALPVGVVAAITLLSAILAVRRARAIGYQLREDDLLFRRGLLWSRMVAVPYGRMQLVDIQQGPIARAMGFSSLKMVTATAVTGVSIPGIDAREADQLRDRLVALAESRRAGL